MSEVCIPAFVESLVREAGIGPVSMMQGSLPTVAGFYDAGPRLEPEALACFLVADQNRGRAVDDTGRVARVVYVIDLLDLRDASESRSASKPKLRPIISKLGLSCPRSSMVVPGTHVLVTVEHHDANARPSPATIDSSEVAAFPRGRSASVLALDRQMKSTSCRLYPCFVAIKSAPMP